MTFERFLARLQDHPGSPWFLKGAFALELRLGDRARTTRDLDLGTDLGPGTNSPVTKDQVARLLQEAAAFPLEDFFEFVVTEGEELLPDQEIRAYRFNVKAFLADRIFESFVLDIGTMVPLVLPPDQIDGSGILGFSGVPPKRFRVVSLPQQIAEKIHAFTFPWKDRENTRVKDLVDLMLILEVSPPDPKTTRKALEAVFGERTTHPLPASLPPPPASWSGSYTAIAKELKLTHTRIEDAIRFLDQYWTEVFP
ncbi:MAG TPA: nucleotidyl transferase AbiEii/AbiGii toxin family protein [Dissulfurispiraceae bacterium]|nr:nucleotidyl transferase AbiEii/AbiGii toxin family protein [Dissulfurispiraceae bacterium]